MSDPACGAGAMLIAFANVSREQGINFQQKVLFVAQDIDVTATRMCYLQLAVLGCPAIVICGGQSGKKPGFHPDNNVWYTPFYYLNEWRFVEKKCREQKVRRRLLTLFLRQNFRKTKTVSSASSWIRQHSEKVSRKRGKAGLYYIYLPSHSGKAAMRQKVRKE